MSVVAVMSVKGGVGKTSVCAGLASAGWAGELPIAVVDADPSANVSWALGVGEREERGGGLSEALRGRAYETIACWDGSVSLVEPGDLSSVVGRALTASEQRGLRKVLAELKRDNELVLVDCPAGTGPLTQAVLANVDAALVISEPSALGVLATADTESFITSSRASNRKLKSLGLIVDRLPGRGREASERFAELAETAGRRLWRPPVPARVVFAEAVADGSPIHAWGVRGAEIAGIFDSYLSRLRRALA